MRNAHRTRPEHSPFEDAQALGPGAATRAPGAGVLRAGVSAGRTRRAFEARPFEAAFPMPDPVLLTRSLPGTVTVTRIIAVTRRGRLHDARNAPCP
jgi:hypothetical protein